MELLWVYIFGIVYLLILSIIDVATFKTQKANIPSIFTDLFIVLALIFSGQEAVYIALISAAIALFLYDLPYFNGMADVKVMVGASILLGSMLNFIQFLMAVMLFGFIYKTVALRIIRKTDAVVPFLPTFLVSFVVVYWI